jgi:hypothetical protein
MLERRHQFTERRSRNRPTTPDCRFPAGSHPLPGNTSKEHQCLKLFSPVQLAA